MAADEAFRLRLALETLPERERIVLGLAYSDGFTQSEIAEHLGLPLGTVKTRTRSGLARLADHLERAAVSEQLEPELERVARMLANAGPLPERAGEPARARARDPRASRGCDSGRRRPGAGDNVVPLRRRIRRRPRPLVLTGIAAAVAAIVIVPTVVIAERRRRRRPAGRARRRVLRAAGRRCRRGREARRRQLDDQPDGLEAARAPAGPHVRGMARPQGRPPPARHVRARTRRARR